MSHLSEQGLPVTGDLPPYLADLNKEQFEAATHIYGPELILSGAGTGKTKTLVARVSYLLDQNIDPENILLLTFTKKAAEEMKTRIKNSIGERADKVLACTFHAFCNLFLRKHAYEKGFSPDFIVINEDDAKAVIKQFINEKKQEMKRTGTLFGDGNALRAEDILKASSISVNNMIPIKMAIGYVENLDGWGLESYEIIQSYIQYKKKRNMMDYDDLLYFTTVILHENPSLRKAMDRNFQFIMCDEYQDTNLIQDDILCLLSKDYPNLAVVGDDNQSIYRFRGANVGNILSFKDRYPGCKVVTLVENYRSTQQVLNLSNAVMRYAKEGIPKELHGQRDGQLPVMKLFDNEYSIARYVTSVISNLHENGMKYRDMAVIVRSGAHSDRLEANLIRAGIPFEKFGGVKLFQKKAIREILSFIRSAASDKDEVGWMQMVSLYPGIGSTAARKIAADMTDNGFSSLLSLTNTKQKYYMELEKIEHEISILRSLSIYDQIDQVLPYYKTLMTNVIHDSKRGEDVKQDDLRVLEKDMEDAQVLLDIAKEYSSTREFLDELVLNSVKKEPDGDYVNITTIHSAKGLEYDTVFLLNPVHGCFPRRKGIADDEDDREELRCLYVALTRAKNRLYICIPEQFQGRFSDDCKLSHHLAHDDVLECCTYDESIKELYPDEERTISWDFR